MLKNKKQLSKCEVEKKIVIKQLYTKYSKSGDHKIRILISKNQF